MTHYTRIRILFFLFLTIPIHTYAQSVGDFRSKASGNWGDNTTWEVYTGTTWINASVGEFPGGSSEANADNVYLEAGFTVTLETNHSCKSLHLNTTGDVIRINTQENTLDVWGKMRFYEGSAPGAATPNPVTTDGVPGWISTGANGFIRFRGTIDRVIMVQGEVNSNNDNSGWNMDFAFEPFVIGQLNDRIRAQNIHVTSGDLFLNNLNAQLRLGTNSPGDVTPNGSLLIKSGASLRGGEGVYKNGSTPAKAITVEDNGTLTITRNGYILAAEDLTLNGTVALQNTISFPTPAGRAGAEPVNTFNDLSIEGQGTKTLTSDIIVNGKLTMKGLATMSLGAFTLAYGASGELEYSGSSAQTTSNAEFPEVAGPSSLTIMNPNGVNLHASRTIEGGLTLGSGLFILNNNHLTLGATSPAVAGTLSASNMVLTNGTGELRKIFTAPGTFLFPIGENTGTTEYSFASINLNNASPFDNATYIGMRVIDAVHPASDPSLNISRYWRISSNLSNIDYGGTFQYLPADVTGAENNLGAYAFSDETSLASIIQLTDGDENTHQLMIESHSMASPVFISGSIWVIQSIENLVTMPGLKIFPNPVKETLKLDFEFTNYNDIQITVLNSKGDIVLMEHATPMTAKTIDVSSFSSGFYFARILVDGKKQATYKIIKE